MAVYVDRMQEMQDGKLWCHMATDGDIEELHAFAGEIGLKRGWFQPKSLPHYDLTQRKRERAIAHGAVSVSTRELIEKCKRKVK